MGSTEVRCPPHLSSGLAVVLVHGAQRVAGPARRHVPHRAVHEPAAEPGTKLDVVRAAAPMPALRHRTGAATQPGVAAALRHVALAAETGDGVDQTCRHNRVDERRLFGSWGDGETSVPLIKYMKHLPGATIILFSPLEQL